MESDFILDKLNYLLRKTILGNEDLNCFILTEKLEDVCLSILTTKHRNISCFSSNCVLLENSLPQFFERAVIGDASKSLIELLKPQRKSPSDKLIQLYAYSFPFTYSKWLTVQPKDF